MQPDSECDLCEGTGTMTWQQPLAGPDGRWSLHQAEHPCVNGCSGWWQLPAAESGGVLGPGNGVMSGGNVAQANEQLRTDWSWAPELRHGPPTR